MTPNVKLTNPAAERTANEAKRRLYELDALNRRMDTGAPTTTQTKIK